jgi:hypothetical protein
MEESKPFIQSDLTIEEQKKAQSMYNMIRELLKFQNTATPKLFKWLWGDQQGEHLWEIFVLKSNRDIMHFLNQTSSDVRITLVCNLVKENYSNGSINHLYVNG